MQTKSKVNEKMWHAVFKKELWDCWNLLKGILGIVFLSNGVHWGMSDKCQTLTADTSQ